MRPEASCKACRHYVGGPTQGRCQRVTTFGSWPAVLAAGVCDEFTPPVQGAAPDEASDGCGSCRFFEGHLMRGIVSNEDDGRCRRYPPPFPMTDEDNWCGDFAPLEADLAQAPPADIAAARYRSNAERAWFCVDCSAPHRVDLDTITKPACASCGSRRVAPEAFLVKMLGPRWAMEWAKIEAARVARGASGADDAP